MTITVTACDVCRGVQGISLPRGTPMVILSCGHAVCGKHNLKKNERGEIICPHRCGSQGTVYIGEIRGDNDL